MPRKKYKRNQKLKQTKIIQTRLMDISLKMDNYIYKNRPISMSEAQMYYQEVTSYKTQCGDNARILQVIDKLKHQLKALIEENQGSADYYNVQEIIENSTTVCPLSPTYSAHSEVIEAPAYEEQHEIDNNITINRPCNTIDTIDVCSEEDIDYINLKEIPTNQSGSNIKDIERSLSNLTFNEEDATKTQHFASLIDNVISKNIIQGPKSQISKDKIKTVEKHTQKQLSSELVTHNKIDKYKTKVDGANFTPNTHNPSQDINKSAVPNKIEDEIKGKKVIRRKRSSNSKTNDNASKPKVPKPKKPRKQKTCTPQVTTKNKMVDNSYTESIPPLVKASNYNLTMPKLLLKSSESKSHPINSVYNSNVVNDLSWVENIRYIREVASDEIDPKLTYLDDSFWQTSELPTNWNDQDFLY